MDRSAIPAIPAHAIRHNNLEALLVQHRCCIIAGALRPALVTRVRAAAADAFALPERQRMAYRSRASGSGYLPPGAEGVATYAPTFARHAWDFQGPRFRHRFPREVPALAPAAGTLARACVRLGIVIGRSVAAALPDDRAAVFRTLRSGHHFLRVLHYPAMAPTTVIEPRFPPHRDFGLFTIVIGGAEDGFEIETPHGWTSVTLAPTDVLIFGGTMLHLVSGGRISAARHRIAAIAHERIAMTCFIEPHPTVLLPNGETADAYLTRCVRKIRHA